MSGFDTYFLMKTEDVGEYVQEKLHFFEDGVKLESKEIGDGNLNYVFRIKDTKSGKSIIVKQAEEVTEMWYKEKMSPKGIKVFNPAFDVTDNDLISGIVTE